MTIEDENDYQNSENCWICNEKITENKDKIKGQYRGPARSKCNLKLQIPRKLPFISHNLKGYDGDLTFK